MTLQQEENKKPEPVYNPEWIPTHSVWELTLQCNMRCLHCGSYAGVPREDELSIERALELVDELADLGLQRITLSGGEPLMRKDWHKIAQKLIDRGVRTGMISNGWFVEEKIEEIKSVKGWDLIAMSLDGLRRTHDAFRRRPGSFDKILTGYKLLKKAHIETACITYVSQYNFNELDAIHDVLLTHGVASWQVQPLFVGGRTRERKEMMLEAKDLFEIAKFIARKRKVSPMNIFPADGIGYFSKYEDDIKPYGWHGCQAGLKVVGIEANGNIKGCLSLYPEAQENNPFVEGNIKEKSLKEIWENPHGFAYNRQFDCSLAEGFCAQCEHLARCRCGCGSEAYFSTGTTYNNPYCMHREKMEKGEPLTKTNVPMTRTFEKKMNEYHSKTQQEKSAKRKKRIRIL